MKKLFLGYEFGTLFVNNRGFANSGNVDKGFSKKCDLSKKNIENMLNNLSKEYSSRKFSLSTNIDLFYDDIHDYLFKSKTIINPKDGSSFQTGLYFKKAQLYQRLYLTSSSIGTDSFLGVYTSSRPSKEDSPLVFEPINSLRDISYTDFFSLMTSLSQLKPYSQRKLQVLSSGYATPFLKKLNNNLKSLDSIIEVLPPRFE